MDYFVSAEDTAYHHWQLELLIESFKVNNLADRLVIALAETNEDKSVDFTANLRTFERIFTHENIGRKRGYLPMNRPYSLLAALEQRVIEQPFTLIDPDMLLVAPIPLRKENVTFQLNPLFTSDAVEPNLPIRKHVREILKLRKVEDSEINYWIPLGSVMTFNDVPRDFFNRAVEWTEILEFARQKEHPGKSWWPTEKAAWVMSLLEYHGHLTYKGVYEYEMNLLDNNMANHFVHYTHGLPPVFSKYHYRYNSPEGFAMGDLFEVFLTNNPTSTTNYARQIVQSFLRTRTPLRPLDLENVKVNEVEVDT